MRTPGALAGKRILIVEDQYYVADDLRKALLREGSDVVGPVPTLEAGLALALGGRLDAALLDVNLDGKMSFPLADLLVRDSVPFVFATGYNDWALPDRFSHAARVNKPFGIPAVLAALDQLLLSPISGSVP